MLGPLIILGVFVVIALVSVLLSVFVWPMIASKPRTEETGKPDGAELTANPYQPIVNSEKDEDVRGFVQEKMHEFKADVTKLIRLTQSLGDDVRESLEHRSESAEPMQNVSVTSSGTVIAPHPLVSKVIQPLFVLQCNLSANSLVKLMIGYDPRSRWCVASQMRPLERWKHCKDRSRECLSYRIGWRIRETRPQ